MFADVGGLFGYMSFEFSFGKGFYNTPSVIIHGEMVAAIGHRFWEQHFPLGLGQQSGQHYLKRPTSKVSEVSTWKGHMLKGTGMICSWHCAGSSRLFVGHVDLPVIYIFYIYTKYPMPRLT